MSAKELLHANIDQTLVKSSQELLKFEIGGLDCRVITTEYFSCQLNTHVTPILQYIGSCNIAIRVEQQVKKLSK